MSLDKAIASGKERRKPFRGSKSFDSTCRNHGGCPWCEGARTHQARRLAEAAQAEEKMHAADFEEMGRVKPLRCSRCPNPATCTVGLADPDATRYPRCAECAEQ